MSLEYLIPFTQCLSWIQVFVLFQNNNDYTIKVTLRMRELLDIIGNGNSY
jgi:hypothetical protein